MASKKEENQLIRTLLPIILTTFIATIGYIGSNRETREIIIMALIFCAIICFIGISRMVAKHISNQNEIED